MCYYLNVHFQGQRLNVGHTAQLLASVYSRFTTIRLCPKQTSTSLNQNVGHFSFCAIYVVHNHHKVPAINGTITSNEIKNEKRDSLQEYTRNNRTQKPPSCVRLYIHYNDRQYFSNICCCWVPTFRLIGCKNVKKIYNWLIRAF